MKKKLQFIFILLISISGFSQSQWSRANKVEVTPNKNVLRKSFPKEFDLYNVSTGAINLSLRNAPNRLTANNSKTVISIPNMNGQLERFEIFEFSNFAPELQAQFPQIRSYVGKGLDDKYATIRLSSDPSGIQSMIFRTGKNNEFMEPYSIDGSVYAIYESQRNSGELPFTCSTVDAKLSNDLRGNLPSSERSASGEMLVFRLALSCNGEYSTYFGGTVANSLAAMNATMTRVNGICEKDLAIHMNIIANNTAVIYTNAASDPYSSMGNWNGELQATLTATIGEANYDIGHMFGATGGGGNAGCIGCVCVDGQKGSGITSPGDGIPMGDNFDVDYVVHEMGHQYGGTHSFSHNVEGSGTNVEPGSGSTIMGYAGITTRDVQAHSDAYFVYANVKQIQDNMVGKTCPVRTTLSNATPTANAGLDYTIPKSTPFILSGTGSDPNGDALTYCWEENDTATTQTGVGSAASATKTGGPNWRSYSPVASPDRYCPPLARVIANASTTQGLEIVTEALSSVARDLNFVLTVRDNHAGTGQTASDAMKVTVNATAGPFLVTAPNTALVSWAVGTNQNVTWDVAGTTANNVNAAYVDIYLSTDGGLTYPILLASQVPNDGTEVITVPNNVGTTNRVMVKGNNHIFYDISNVNFPIVAATSSFSVSFNRTAGQQNKSICASSTVDYAINYLTYAGFSGITAFSVSGQPAGTTVTFAPATLLANGTTTMTISNTSGATPGFYSMIVTATSGAVTKTVPFYLSIFSPNFATTTGISPADNAIGQSTSVNLSWATDANATQYDVQVATDNAFTNIIASGTANTNSYSVTGLSEVTNYYWRVLPKNGSCSGVFSTGFKFTTGQIVCSTFTSANVPLTIATTANVTVNSTLAVADVDTISDVNVTMNISHTWVNDLTITLISPAGTQVQLVAQPCASASLLNIVATFDDSGIPLVCGTDPAISSTIIPIQALSAFNGQTMNGTWTLRVFDGFNQDGGSLNSWSLNLCHTTPGLGVTLNTIKDFSLYPNPNNGNFNIQFNSTSNDDISVSVFDIRGRNVYSNSYKNNGLFNENIQLDSLEAGVYLVSVKDGQNQITKKIIKE